VVEVLVDELEEVRISNWPWGSDEELWIAGVKHTSLEALAMSLKAGGGNRGTTFSTLTYSAMMESYGESWGWSRDGVMCGGGAERKAKFCAPQTR